MQIRINKKSLYSLSVVLSKMSVALANEVETVQNGLSALHGDFLDPSYDRYASEYIAALREINQQCEDLEILAVQTEAYYKKLADL